MKVTFMRTGVALALVLGMAACGGGKATFSLTGKVTGQAYNGLVLTNQKNGDTLTINAPTGSNVDVPFAMPKVVEYGEEYDVQVTAQPANQTCTWSRGADTAGRLDAINIIVNCTINTFSIGGTVTGLTDTAGTTASGLVIANGADRLAIEKNGAYTMPSAVAFGAPYGVAILSQPTNPARTCRVENPTGTVNTHPVNGVNVGVVNNINIICS